MDTDEAARERMRSIFDSHRSDLLRYAVRRVGVDAAPDVVSEVFLVAWRRLPEVPPDPLPWLYGVARGVLANQRRAVERQARLIELATVSVGLRSSEEAISQVEEAVTSAAIFAAAFYRLSEDDQEVLALISWEGLTARDVAAAFDCSIPTMTTRLYRARRRLRANLDDQSKEI